MYYDTPPPPVVTVPDSMGPVPPGYKDDGSTIKLDDHSTFKDDEGTTAGDAVNNFFSALNNHDCHTAWSMTYNDYWLSMGEDWFCSYNAFGGVNKVVIKNISPISQNETDALMFANYYAEDIYNGNKCFKETITVRKMTYTDNRSRWTITKINSAKKTIKTIYIF